MNEFIALLLTTLILIILDIVWFSFSVKPIYEPTFLSVQKSPLKMRVGGGIVAWFLIAIGIRYFCHGTTPITAFLRGALLGLIIYGVYNGTSYATLTDYPLKTALIDTLWGVFAVGTVATISGFMQR